MELVFATGNTNKMREVAAMMPDGIAVKSLADIGLLGELPETQATIEGNAVQKANFVFENKWLNCFAEDTGLEVDALDGAPGVFSARYAGPEKNARANMEKVLQQLEGVANRSAQFRTVIALILSGQLHRFEGAVRGTIINSPRGAMGFGYDPIFRPDGYTQTFAELGDDVKNKISHRAKALNRMIEFLKGCSIQP
jgi:XTP/dITP diphosphohydrolase